MRSAFLHIRTKTQICEETKSHTGPREAKLLLAILALSEGNRTDCALAVAKRVTLVLFSLACLNS